VSTASRVQHYVDLVREYQVETIGSVRQRLYAACTAMYEALTVDERDLARVILEREKEG